MATTLGEVQNTPVQAELKKPFVKWMMDFFASKKIHLLFTSGSSSLFALLPHLGKSPFTSICPLNGLNAYHLAKTYAQNKGFGLFVTDEKEEQLFSCEEEDDTPLLILVLEQGQDGKEYSQKTIEETLLSFSYSVEKTLLQKQVVKIKVPISFLLTQKSCPFPSKHLSFNPYLLSQALFFSQQILLSATDPLILVGGSLGSEEAYTALLQFAETFKIPLSATKNAKGVICERHPLFIGIQNDQSPIFPSDCLIVIGGKESSHFEKKAPIFAASSIIRARQKSFSSLPLHTFLRSLCKISWNLPLALPKIRKKDGERTVTIKKNPLSGSKEPLQRVCSFHTHTDLKPSFTKNLSVKKEHILSLLSEYLTDAHLLTSSSLLEPIALKIPVEKDCYCPPSSCPFYPIGVALARAHKRLLFLLDETALETGFTSLQTAQILGLTPIFLILHSKKNIQNRKKNLPPCLLHAVQDAYELKNTFKSALQEPAKISWIECTLEDLPLWTQDKNPTLASI